VTVPRPPGPRIWSLYAPAYDALVARLTADARRRSIAALGLRAGERVLVLGCGTGLDFCTLPTDVRIVAGDLSPAMVDRARARALRAEVIADVRVMDAARTGEPAASFDAAVLHLILAIVPDPRAVLAEAARVLRPGGRAVVFDKFVPGDGRPGALRRGIDVVSTALATSVTRRLPELVDPALWVVEHEEPSLLRGQFRIALLRRR
jgi:ubiquinone/menaquinone biosynthesis C-methylase UbiE